MASTTIVVPCFNEERRLDIESFQSYVAKAIDLRLLFVNDGSRDRTLDRLEQIRTASPDRVAILNLAQNSGKAEAVRLGLRHAMSGPSRYVGFWDADLATPLAEIDNFRKALDQHPAIEIAIGARIPLLGHAIDRRPLRFLLSRLFAKTASTLLGLRVFDTQCGAKLFRASDDLHQSLSIPFATRWIFDVELFARYFSLRRSRNDLPLARIVYEVPLDSWREVEGSKLKSSDFRKAIRELALIYWRYLRRGATGFGPPTVSPPRLEGWRDGIDPSMFPTEIGQDAEPRRAA